VLGGRAIISLPAQKDFYHSLSLGLDYKHFTQVILTAGTRANTPVTYYPVSAAYSGTWLGKGYETDMNGSVNLALRGTGSDEADFELNRHGASGDFIYFRGDLSHTRDLPEGFQAFVKAQGQAADQPLINSEQFSGGGLGTVRGYLDRRNWATTVFLVRRKCALPRSATCWAKRWTNGASIFREGGLLTINDPLPRAASQNEPGQRRCRHPDLNLSTTSTDPSMPACRSTKGCKPSLRSAPHLPPLG